MVTAWIRARFWTLFEWIARPFGYERRATCPYGCTVLFPVEGQGNIFQHIVRNHSERLGDGPD